MSQKLCINGEHSAKQTRKIWRKNFQALLSNHILRVGSFFLAAPCSFAVETCESVDVAVASLFHRILDQRDISAANTSGDSISSDLFDTQTVQQHDDRLRYFSFILSVLKLTACCVC